MMPDAHVTWSIAYIVVLSITMISSFTTLLLSFRGHKVTNSAVQYVLYSVCRSVFIYSVTRLIFCVGVLWNWNGIRDYFDHLKDGQMIAVQIIYNNTHHNKVLVVLIALSGDIALLCMAFWVIKMAYEMTRLIQKSMDRGVVRERRIVLTYNLQTFGTAIIFTSGLVFAALIFPHQEDTVWNIAFFFQLGSVWVSFIYPLCCTIWFSRYQQTQTVVSPNAILLHQRIKRLVIVYCVLVFPYCIIQTLTRCDVGISMNWVGIAQLLYYFSGAGTVYVIGASVTCCYRTLRPIMPPSVYEHLLENGYFPDDVSFNPDRIVEPPTDHPIFVFTDIEGSTALWAAVPQAMAHAQSQHDDILRLEVLRCRGYEITTVGDAFQLAFHTVSDAIGWCIVVQEKLLKAEWPRDLLAQDSAARITDSWGRVVFNGLRVRMGIHVGDDKLVCSKHPVTGKMTYLGVSENVASELGDMGRGGEILISDPALNRYVETERTDVTHKVHGTFHTELHNEPYSSPELQVTFPLHRVIPKSTGDRFDRDPSRSSDYPIRSPAWLMKRHLPQNYIPYY